MGVFGSGASTTNEGNTLVGVATAGVWGDSPGAGLLGSSDAGNALSGFNNSDNSATILGFNDTASTSGALLLVQSNSGDCSIDSSGTLTCSGSIGAAMPLKDGRRVAEYAMQSPENWSEDFGSARLVNGVAIVKLEPTFAQTVNTGIEYHVFLTPSGDCKGLYVQQKSTASFEVRELGGGTSSISFDYRIVAKRLGQESKRLVDVQPMMEKWKSGMLKRKTSAVKESAIVGK
jgi:hypothetical protein